MKGDSGVNPYAKALQVLHDIEAERALTSEDRTVILEWAAGEAALDGLLKFSDSSPNYVVYDREQLWRWDGEEWVLVESRKEGDEEEP